MGREFERKFRAEPAAFRLLRQDIPGFVPITMETVYYDTPTGALGSRKWMLRLRSENGRSICTLKTPLPDGSRGEWEAPAEEIGEGVAELCKQDCPTELSGLARDGFFPVCGARFLRLAAPIRIGDTLLELALDEGFLSGGGKQLPITEVEVELKEGSEEQALSYARALADRYGLLPEPDSKLQRALALSE